MIIAGELSGLHDALFGFPDQSSSARQLRPRAFRVQLLAESVAQRLLHACGLIPDSLLFCGGGFFVIDASRSRAPDRLAERLGRECAEVEDWLLEHLAGQVKLAVAASDQSGTPVDQFRLASDRLRMAKLRQWSAAAGRSGAWEPSRLVCRDVDVVQRLRDADLELARLLPRAQWLVIDRGDVAAAGALELVGLRISFQSGAMPESPGDAPLAHANLLHPTTAAAHFPRDRFIARRLARHIPLDSHGVPIELSQLAGRARGQNLLGVLRLEVDALPAVLAARLEGATDLAAWLDLARRVDEFFAATLQDAIEPRPWNMLYTIFGGGGGALLAGPWDLVLDFAALAQQLFAQAFAAEALTLSAGAAIVGSRQPMKVAVEEANRLLERARTTSGRPGQLPRDQVAALGQVWSRADHAAIVAAGKRVADWIDQNALPRREAGVLLELAEQLRTVAPAERGLLAARLAHRVENEYPRRKSKDPARAALRQWAEELTEQIARLDPSQDVEAMYLPAIMRYALAAGQASGGSL